MSTQRSSRDAIQPSGTATEEQNGLQIVSWNVNGLRSCARKGFGNWLQSTTADIVALQEVRALPEQLPDDVRAPDGWWTDFFPATRLGYSGVALYARQPPSRVEQGLGIESFDQEGRVQLAHFGPLLLVNGYFPNGNGKDRDNSRVPFKLDFYRALFDRLRTEEQAGRHIVVVGDLNTAHRAIDLARPKANEKTSGFLPEERAELDRWMAHGWVDTFRSLEPGPNHYSWWSQRGGARARNVGWRIDYILASASAAKRLRSASIHPDVLGSDHCPVSAIFDPQIWADNAEPPAATRLPKPTL